MRLKENEVAFRAQPALHRWMTGSETGRALPERSAASGIRYALWEFRVEVDRHAHAWQDTPSAP